MWFTVLSDSLEISKMEREKLGAHVHKDFVQISQDLCAGDRQGPEWPSSCLLGYLLSQTSSTPFVVAVTLGEVLLQDIALPGSLLFYALMHITKAGSGPHTPWSLPGDVLCDLGSMDTILLGPLFSLAPAMLLLLISF